MDKKIDIIIISYNTCELTLNCIRSIIDTSKEYVNKIIVVDNNSTDDTIDRIKENFEEVELVVNPENYGYAKAVNIGFKHSQSEFVLISNSDVIYLEGSLVNLLKTFEEIDNCGVCGPLQLFPNGKIQRSYGDLPGFKLGLKDFTLLTHIQEKFRKFFPAKSFKKVPYIDGAVMLVNRYAFKQVGGFDEDYFFYTEEADFCYKIRKKGFAVIHNPLSKVIHYRGATEEFEVDQDRIDMLISSKALFCKKHLSFNEAKLFMILEVLYSYNLWLIFLFLSLISFGKNKYRNKMKIFKFFGEAWLRELTEFLRG